MSAFIDKWKVFRELWWMDDAVNEHAAVEGEYNTMYLLWHTSESDFWTPLVGKGESVRFGYSTIRPAWNRLKRLNSLDTTVPKWIRSNRFRGHEST